MVARTRFELGSTRCIDPVWCDDDSPVLLTQTAPNPAATPVDPCRTLMRAAMRLVATSSRVRVPEVSLMNQMLLSAAARVLSYSTMEAGTVATTSPREG